MCERRQHAARLTEIAPADVSNTHHHQIFGSVCEHLMRKIRVLYLRVEFDSSFILGSGFELRRDC